MTNLLSPSEEANGGRQCPPWRGIRSQVQCVHYHTQRDVETSPGLPLTSTLLSRACFITCKAHGSCAKLTDALALPLSWSHDVAVLLSG